MIITITGTFVSVISDIVVSAVTKPKLVQLLYVCEDY